MEEEHEIVQGKRIMSAKKYEREIRSAREERRVERMKGQGEGMEGGR